LVESVLSFLPFLPLEWNCKFCMVFWSYIASFWFDKCSQLRICLDS
jgi:hypothetical protein